MAFDIAAMSQEIVELPAEASRYHGQEEGVGGVASIFCHDPGATLAWRVDLWVSCEAMSFGS